MGKNNTEVIVGKLPKCGFCDNLAVYDARTASGHWAFMCEDHFKEHGLGLGLGKGQRLVLRSEVEVKKNVTVNILELAEQALVDGIIECPHCGTSIEPDCNRCPNCGWINALMALGIM